MPDSMSHEKRLGWAALAMSGLGAGALYLWPNERWIGWTLFLSGITSGLFWGYLEIKPFGRIARRIIAFAFLSLFVMFVFVLNWPKRIAPTASKQPEALTPKNESPKEQEVGLSEIQRELRELRKEIAKEKLTNAAKMSQSNSASDSKIQILTLAHDLLNFLLREEEYDPRNIFHKSDPESIQDLNQRTKTFLTSGNEEFKKDYDGRITIALQVLADSGINTDKARRACFENRGELGYVQSCSDSLKQLAQQLK